MNYCEFNCECREETPTANLPRTPHLLARSVTPSSAAPANVLHASLSSVNQRSAHWLIIAKN